MNRRNLIRTCAVGLTCTAVGAGAGILGSASAAPSAATSAANAAKPANARIARLGRLRALVRSVHAEVVVPTAGGGFATATYDRGFVETVSATQLTLREGTQTATYQTVTLTIPGNATIRLDRAPAQLSQLKPGDRVRVLSGPKHTRVAAFDTQAANSTPTG
jgi:hypothetical protein